MICFLERLKGAPVIVTLNSQRNHAASFDAPSEAKILVVDDEPNIRFFLERVLSKEGYQVTTAASGKESLALVGQEAFDLVLLDLKLRDVSGLDVLEVLHHEKPGTAVIILTGYASLETAVEALRHGAHDYLYKPTKADNLRESVRQALQKRQRELRHEALIGRLEETLVSSLEEIRATGNGVGPENTHASAPVGDAYQGVHEDAAQAGCAFIRCGPWFVDLARHCISIEGEVLDLTPTEFAILAYMIGEAPKVVSYQEFVTEVQGYEDESWGANETVRYHIHNIRSKLEDAIGCATLIRTVRGVGYAVEESLN
jgi:DNA-binding response OmpR family regulator